ncbi:hypothetical protein BLOT_000752 [Blomia tropicalis]|nr:hypothetical protein BLOT_000752 [Blomia tropicalis]
MQGAYWHIDIHLVKGWRPAKKKRIKCSSLTNSIETDHDQKGAATFNKSIVANCCNYDDRHHIISQQHSSHVKV